MHKKMKNKKGMKGMDIPMLVIEIESKPKRKKKKKKPSKKRKPSKK